MVHGSGFLSFVLGLIDPVADFQQEPEREQDSCYDFEG
jgi:hypothetical protein